MAINNNVRAFIEQQNRVVFVRIDALDDMDEKIKSSNDNGAIQILGQATDGSISIDGASSLRRTCNLNLITSSSFNSINYDWAKNTRFKLWLGLKNNVVDNEILKQALRELLLSFVGQGDIDKAIEFDNDIVWFSQGIFLITSFNASFGVSSSTISISGQDKMCLLNGEVSGIFMQNALLDTQEDEKGTVSKTPLDELVKSLLIVYSKDCMEPVVSLPMDKGVNLLTYKGNEPLYLFIQKRETGDDSNSYKAINASIYGDQPSYGENPLTLGSLSSYFIPKNSSITGKEEQLGTQFPISERESCYIQKVTYGETAGYEATELVFAGELSVSVGEPITSALDRIKDMLGNYEYFYDIVGRFHFQKQPNYINTEWNGIGATEAESINYSYEFKNQKLFTSIADVPDLKNLKNDFTVWGEKTSVSGSKLPIHMRIAVDTKPTRYQSPWQDEIYTIENFDWRELIYQMAVDYRAHQHEDNFISKLKAANPDLVDGAGRTGYEEYYTDLEGFWRQLYNPLSEPVWEETYYNKNLEKELYGIEMKAVTKDTAGPLDDYTKYYIQKSQDTGSYYVTWLDSLNLSDDNQQLYSLTNLYKRMNDTYAPLISTEYPPAIYYYYDNNTEEYKTIEYLVVDDNIKKQIYYQASGKTEYIPLVRGVDQEATPFEDYLENAIPYYRNTESEEYQLLINYLATQPNSIISIYNIYVKRDDNYIPIVETIPFNRTELFYLTKSSIADGEEITKYIPLSSYPVAKGTTLYTISRSDSPLTNRPDEEYRIYTTNYKGEVLAGAPYITLLPKYYRKVNHYIEGNYWHKDVAEAPESLLFWFDFLDGEAYKSYSKQKVGSRPKATQEAAVTGIYYKSVPSVVFNKGNIQLPKSLSQCFTISSQGLNAHEAIDNLIYNHCWIANGLSITAIPIYWLQPNSRIKVLEEDYIVDKITMPLTYSGLMTMSVTKAPPNNGQD